MKFLDVKIDYAFKKVFGSEDSKDILISFLNALIYEKKPTKIKDLTIVDPYNVPHLKGVKESYVDVKAILNNDTKVIIEMQVLHHQAFVLGLSPARLSLCSDDKRVLYNLAKNYSMQLNEAEDYHLLNPVISLNIVDFIMFNDTNKVITNFKLIAKEEFINYSDDIELVFIELPKFKKELDELKTLTDQWIYFIQNAGSLEYIPNNFDSTIKNSFDILNEANLTKDELEIQHKQKEFISIQKLAIMKATNDGLSKGIEQGTELRNIKIAKNSILQGLDDKTISSITNLPLDIIQNLRDEIQD